MLPAAYPTFNHFRLDCFRRKMQRKGELFRSRPPGVAAVRGADSWLCDAGLPPPPSVSSHHFAPQHSEKGLQLSPLTQSFFTLRCHLSSYVTALTQEQEVPKLSRPDHFI